MKQQTTSPVDESFPVDGNEPGSVPHMSAVAYILLKGSCLAGYGS